MKKIVLVVLVLLGVNTYLGACEGDCVVCHPKLVKEDGKLDKDHAILVTCKTCHTQEEMEKIDMGSGCGQDCWDCHDIKKVTASGVPQHKNLQTCIDCHVTIDKSMFGGDSVSAFSQMPTLDTLMGGSVESKTEMSVASVTAELNKTTVKKSDSNESKEEVIKKK
jgi:formate-dependent nitrite reductase cytochrome c552 subunit